MGYIGTVLVPGLRDAGHDVVGLDSDLYRACTYGDAPDTVPSIRKDVRDVERADVEGFDAVLHLAGLSNDPLGDLDPDLTDAINHRASVRLAELCRDAGVSRFVFSSSCSNYGAGGDGLLDEASPFNPVTPYGRSKVAVEAAVAPMADDRFCPVFLRNATAYGMSPRLRFDLVVNNLTAWAFTTGQVRLKSDGSPWRPVVHVRDIAAAFIACLRTPADRISGRAFNIARTSENHRVRDIATIVGEAVPGSEVTLADGAGPDVRNYRVNGDAALRILHGFVPSRTVRDGVRELLDAFRANGLTLEAFEGPTYQRIAHIRQRLAEKSLADDLRPVERAAARPGVRVP